MKKISVLIVTLIFPLFICGEGKANIFECCLGNVKPQTCSKFCIHGVSKSYTVIFDDPQCAHATNKPHGCYCYYGEKDRLRHSRG